MAETRFSSGYALAAIIGALAGGAAVLVLTRAIPSMFSRIMPTMMQKMMTRIGGEGCDPEEM